MDKNAVLDIIRRDIDAATAGALKDFLEGENDEAISRGAEGIARAFALECNASFLGDICRDERKLITSFYNNLTLLVQKTWVEHFDDEKKSAVLFALEDYCKEFLTGDERKLFSEFLSIIRDAVYLMFGEMTRTDSFMDWAVRVDPQFGLFWGYIESLGDGHSWDNQKLKLSQELGMFFLANY